MSLKDQMASAFRFKSGGNKYIQPKDEFIYAPDDDQFMVCDPADTTKCVRFDAGGVTTATTRVFSLPDADVSANGVGSRRNIVDTAGVFATPIVLTAAESSNWYLLDDAAGLDFTLPALSGAATNGIHYTFFVNVTNTSNSYRLTAATGDLLRGSVLSSDFDAAYTAPQILAAEADESNDLVFTLAAAAQGGRAGGWFDITAIHATGWFMRGNLLADGVVVTPFS